MQGTEAGAASGDPGCTPAYVDVFAEYARTHSEAALYRASLLSQAFVKQGVGPDEIIGFHGEAVERISEGLSDHEKVRIAADALLFLLEVMIAYGVQHAAFTELKARDAEQRALAALQRAEEAHQADQHKAELMALVAHELRTPLTAALGQVQFARRSLASGNMERLPRLLDSAEESLRRLSRLATDLAEASRGESPVLQRTPQELTVLLAKACTLAAVVAQEKGVELVRESEDGSAWVLGDVDALLTILGNLVGNAVRYTTAGGTVTVRYGTEADQAWVDIADTGIGMSLQVQLRIFEQFFRAPEAQAIEQQGLGLGLFLVKRLVQAHAGRVEVTSAPGVGSTFRVLLPLLKTVEPALPK